jgi:hypothetical protein
MGFNKRKWWNFNNNRSISVEIAGWKSNPSIYVRLDGSERDICFHFAFGFGIWITFERFLPRSWYPTYESKTHGKLPDEREISLSIHGWRFWWNFWVSEEWSSWTKNKTWRKGCWHIVDWIKGKHKHERNEIERHEHVLPFFEGNYNVEVIKFQRIDKWARWPTKKAISWEVKAGYYKDGKFIEKPIPVEGKGENSWDCDENATYSMSFPGHPYRKNIQSSYDAALYFWHSMMKDRERRGSAKWVPKAYSNKPLNILQ